MPNRRFADGPTVPRLAVILAVAFCALAPAAKALAGNPVFAVVPTVGGQRDSLDDAIRQQLKADRSALAASLHTQGVYAARLRHAQAELIQAADPFPAGDRVARLQQALADKTARVNHLRRAIIRLELALRPAVLPAGFSSRSSSATGSYAVSIAQRYLGVRYVWGGSDPGSGFDCSGFVKYVYAQLGVQLPHYAASQFATTRPVYQTQLQPGDLVFFEPRPDGPGHVGMYVGNGLMIAAPHSGDVVKLEQVSAVATRVGFVGASRPTA
jgi:cell wall-associated NlpC family hydrolase